jgi:cyclohexyl-isocyanide hydratase
MISKRDLLVASTVSVAAAGLRAASAAEGAQQHRADHGMASVPPGWYGKEQMAFLIYPEFTALDMVDPYKMLTGLLGSTAHLVAKTRDSVTTDSGLTFIPSKTFDDCAKDLDTICVPGGASGTLAAMQDDGTLRFLKDYGARARFVTSVCTGSLLLGAAGLLTGYKATSHWATVPLLPRREPDRKPRGQRPQPKHRRRRHRRDRFRPLAGRPVARPALAKALTSTRV